MKYLLKHWEEFQRERAEKTLMLFLDYDGTLVPIVERPEKARPSPQAKRLLIQLSEMLEGRIAIISGRSLSDVRNCVGLENIIYSGNHGLEIEGPRLKFESPLSARYRIVLKQVEARLTERLSGVRGAFVEDKGLSFALHYRLVRPKQVSSVKAIFHEITSPLIEKGEIKVRNGKKVFEVNPPVLWDKGKVTLWLLARQQFTSKEKSIFPVYLGDDVTDEDAFRALGRRGATIRVGMFASSSARYYLKNPGEVMGFLERLCPN